MQRFNFLLIFRIRAKLEIILRQNFSIERNRHAFHGIVPLPAYIPIHSKHKPLFSKWGAGGTVLHLIQYIKNDDAEIVIWDDSPQFDEPPKDASINDVIDIRL